MLSNGYVCQHVFVYAERSLLVVPRSFCYHQYMLFQTARVSPGNIRNPLSTKCTTSSVPSSVNQKAGACVIEMSAIAL